MKRAKASSDYGKREMMRRLRLRDLRRLLLDRCGPELPDDDAGREYLHELLLPISVGPNADLKMPKAVGLWAPWMSDNEATELIDRINRTPLRQRMPKARELGERLSLVNVDRERLKTWTIAPCDMTDRQLAEHRKAKDRKRKRRLRKRRGGKPHAKSARRQKPWKAEGISRAKWYRRRRETNSSVVQAAGETNSSAMKLLCTEDKLVSRSKLHRRGRANGHAAAKQKNQNASETEEQREVSVRRRTHRMY